MIDIIKLIIDSFVNSLPDDLRSKMFESDGKTLSALGTFCVTFITFRIFDHFFRSFWG